MNREGKKCVLYPRVSTEMQVDGYSLEGQKNSLKRFADREEMEIVGIYEDAGKSGKSIEGRPAFKKMLSDIKNGLEIEYILVYKLSRFGRNAADILNSLEFVQSYGINLICIEEGIDSSQTSGKLLISVLSAVAEIERENIIEQTMNGRREKAKKSLITYLIKEIQIYPNGESEMPLKSIEFNFPIYIDGKEVRKVLWERGNTVDTETVQRLFIKAYNQMMGNRKQIIEDCEIMRKKLTDFKSLDADIERQLEETQVVAELVKAAVKDNASTAQSQKAYLEKYEVLTQRYETAVAELDRLQNLRSIRSQKDKAMALYIRTLKKQPTVLSEWNDTLWTVMVEKAIVHRNGEITFVFYNGTKVRVKE